MNTELIVAYVQGMWAGAFIVSTFWTASIANRHRKNR